MSATRHLPPAALWVRAASGSSSGPHRTEQDAVREGRRLTSSEFVVWDAATDSPVSYHQLPR